LKEALRMADLQMYAEKQGRGEVERN